MDYKVNAVEVLYYFRLCVYYFLHLVRNSCINGTFALEGGVC